MYHSTLKTPYFLINDHEISYMVIGIQAKSDNENLGEKMVEKNCDICRNFQLGFSSKIKVPQLGSARLGTFIARLGSSWKIPARAHHYKKSYLVRRIVH